MGMEDIEGEGRTMIAGLDVPAKADGSPDPEGFYAYVHGKREGDVIEILGEQYAKLPEGWPAAEAPELEQAHAEAVAGEEPEEDWEDQIREIYASFTPEEVQELCEDWVRLVKEVTALRKGMKTMQRKSRKQTQKQRRLERRLAQARAGREQLRSTAKAIADRKLEDAVTSLAELIDEKGLLVRGEPQAYTPEVTAEQQAELDMNSYFEGLSKEPRSFA